MLRVNGRRDRYLITSIEIKLLIFVAVQTLTVRLLNLESKPEC